MGLRGLVIGERGFDVFEDWGFEVLIRGSRRDEKDEIFTCFNQLEQRYMISLKQ